LLEYRPWFRFWPDGVPRHLDYPETALFGFLAESAKKYQESIAFSVKDRHLTYKALDKSSTRLANALRSMGIGKGSNVILLLQNGLEYVIGYYGILKSGGAVVPTNPLYKKAELEHQCNDASVACIITNEACYPVVDDVRSKIGIKKVILTDTDGIDGTMSLQRILSEYSDVASQVDIKPKEDVAAIQYTGGTTGLPKGAMLTHYNLVANAIQNSVWFNWNHDEVVIGLLPFYHSWGACTCLNSPVYCGARVVILPRFDAEELLMSIEKEKATVLYGAASLFGMLLNSPFLKQYDISSLKYIKAGAMPIPPEIKERWEKVTGVKMVLGYGLSEACPETHNSPPDRVKVGTVGIPIMDTDCRLVDEKPAQNGLPSGQVGEIVIKGPQVMKGYLNRPEDNKEALRDGWLYTGDLAFMDEEGYFHLTDRKKEIIKYKGYTIAPSEIEAALYCHSGVKECAVIGKPDESAGEIPKAYVVVKDGYNLSHEELIVFSEQRLSPFKKVREVEFIDEVPKTLVGKVLRRVLRDRNL
jgi:long-chain acyl-CoA synthetase